MKALRLLRAALVVCALWSFIIPPAVIAADKKDAPAVDVQLTSDGQLVGQYLDGGGQALSEQTLVLQRGTKVIAETITDTQGRFQFDNLHGGLFQLRSAEQVTVCRCWTAGTAPPRAGEKLLIIAQQDVSRGQRPIGEIFSNPLLIGALIAGAVAIPIAIHNSGDDNNGS